MFGRFLSFLGFIPGLSGLSGFAGGYGSSGGGADEDMEAGGEAAVSFTPGKKLSSADAEETPDSRQARITDRDLVWPGKVENIQITNPEPIAYRFDLTVTDLNPAFYIRRPPVGGVPQREGGVLLQPGDEASFEVVFVPPPAGEKLRTRTFGFVLTCFDPRRSGDPGEIVQDMPLRWVGLPGESDLQIAAVPPVIVTRPWRREARFAVKLTNKSFLPPQVGMTILRAPTKDALTREAETVGDIQQALAARTPGVWQCLLPPSSRRGSYYATVRGQAQAAGGVSTPLALPRPVLVRYVPWLRMGRDWAALFGTLAFLLWLVWGIPFPKHPVVTAALTFEGMKSGQMPEGTSLRDLEPTMTLLDDDKTPLANQPPIAGAFNGTALVFKGPQRWYAYRWPFGWSWPNRARQNYQLSFTPKPGKEAVFSAYTFPALTDGTFLDITDVKGMAAAWKVAQAVRVARAPGTTVLINVGDLGGLKDRTVSSLTVNYVLGGQTGQRICPLYPNGHGGYKPAELDLTDQVPPGKSLLLTLRATALGVQSIQGGGQLTVQRQPGAFTFPDLLTFPVNIPLTSGQMAAAARAEARAKTKQDEGDKQKQQDKQKHAQDALKHPSTPAKRPSTAGAGTGGTGSTGSTGGIGSTGSTGGIGSTGGTGSGKGSGEGGGQTLTGGRHPVVSVQPPPVLPPPTPTGLSLKVVSPTQFDLHWDPVPGAIYLLYRSGGSGGGPWPHSTHNTFYSDTGLTPGATYAYRVQSKRGTKSSELSAPVVRLDPAQVNAPATVALTLTARGRDVYASLDFANVSRAPVYLDKVSACAGGKIGDDVFRIRADSQPVPFTGQKSKRPTNPGPRQVITLRPGETTHIEVNLNHSYRFPQGARVYTVTYSAPHYYPGAFQNLSLTSSAVSIGATR